MPLLVDAYLAWKADGPTDSEGAADAWPLYVIGFDALIRHGFIGSSATQPSLAFPLRLLEIYRQLHRVCPRFSLDALSKTLTQLHYGPRKSALRQQLSTAYDAYLEIIRGVDARVQAALGRTGTWYMDNVCPPCLYKTVNEPQLKFSFLAAADGNNSLKSVANEYKSGKPRDDDRMTHHLNDRWLSPEDVDVFKDEVSNSQKPASSADPDATADTHPNVNAEDLDDDVAWLNINELEATEAEELARCLNTCVDRWRAAGPDARKKMFALFAVAGIFLSVCRHGHVLVMCDMIRSGELMKYPLAIVKRLLDRYGQDIGLGYDIMCAFFKTLLRSSLGKRVIGMRLKGVVPAFHGHAHNRACQVGWHPLYVEGVGLEDFEECERTFCKSNHLASVTRLSTAFHRRQQIDEHFYFHDIDKHTSSESADPPSLGNFIYQNYRQAIEKIKINREQLSAVELRIGTTAEDYENDLKSEQAYFRGLRSEPQQESDAAKTEYCRLDYNITQNGFMRSDIARVNTRYRTTHTKYLATLEEVCRYEEANNIEARWTPASQSYVDALVMMTERRYRVAVDDLERLVVQRLFEMTKLGMSGVGYKLREKIGKALHTRKDAIRRALEKYNAAGASLSPPRPRLSYNVVINNVSLAEFDWLRETRQDIRALSWAQPARREAGVLHFGILRSKEEMVRCNVEMRRLITSMLDDHIDYYRAISATIISAPDLARELSRQWIFRNRINTSIATRLALTSRLTRFTGSLFPGDREGIPSPPWLGDVFGLHVVTVDYQEPSDNSEDEEELGRTPAQQREYDVNGMGREEDFEEDLIIDLMDNINQLEM
ncbi:hypothetical protein DFH09DRAFT_1254717 [Mycena vulgaris]|nr:hypothetical protein DFH09DRAFT_1254717 [Mycena vulgaris]